jgi:aprataxin
MPLTCLKCDETFANIPTLKRHLEEDWKRMKRDKLRRIRETGRQSSDEGYL